MAEHEPLVLLKPQQVFLTSPETALCPSHLLWAVLPLSHLLVELGKTFLFVGNIPSNF
jgi:hypothetical protein